jgi:hypothetical protein
LGFCTGEHHRFARLIAKAELPSPLFQSPSVALVYLGQRLHRQNIQHIMISNRFRHFNAPKDTARQDYAPRFKIVNNNNKYIRAR